MQFCIVTLEVMMVPTSMMFFATGDDSQCNTTEIAIRITGGAVWNSSLTENNFRSSYYKWLASTLTAEVSFESFAE